jgi:hypothetical protein
MSNLQRELRENCTYEASLFYPGDIVKYVNGTVKYEVVKRDEVSRTITMRSEDSRLLFNATFNRELTYLGINNLYVDSKVKQENKEMLYEVTKENKTVYVTKLAEDSQGRWVVEPKGGGEILTVDKDDCKKVMPYTVSVKFIGNTKSYSYKAKQGQFKEGDLVMIDGSVALAKVTRINTESDRATKYLTGVKLLGEVITNEEESDS